MVLVAKCAQKSWKLLVIDSFEVTAWVNESVDSKDREFREAVHTILAAIVADPALKADMVIKGGILLAIRYQSGRFTKDIDFSTIKSLSEINPDCVVSALQNSLTQIGDKLEYDLDCRVQSCKVQPKNSKKASFPSIKIVIGYAYKGTRKHDRLLALMSPTTISIDYSLNEQIPNFESLELGLSDEMFAYSLSDLIAEKLRSLLQQIIRNRTRRQDVFDLFVLLEKFPDLDAIEKEQILQSLREKSKPRGVDVQMESLENPEIRRRSKLDYETLADELEGELPEFDYSYDSVNAFYKSLPWGEGE